MSATIYYRKFPKGDPYLHNVGAPSSFMDKMEAVGLRIPGNVTRGDIPILTGMAAMCDDSDNPYAEIIELLGKFEAISLYAQY